MPALETIVPCPWFDRDAEAAAEMDTSIFPNARIVTVSRYSARRGTRATGCRRGRG